MTPTGRDRALDRLLAKSRQGDRPPERLTDHLLATLATARAVKERVGSLPGLPAEVAGRFWAWVELAALLHDAGKVATGFQRQLTGDGWRWGERHEVLSLAFVDLLTESLPALDRHWVGLGVLTHHRPLTAGGGGGGRRRWAIDDCYLGLSGQPDPERLAFADQVEPEHAEALLAWLAEHAPEPLAPAPPDTVHAAPPARTGTTLDLAARAGRLLGELLGTWGLTARVPSPGHGLAAVLLQGAVTMADHLSSAHSPLATASPLPPSYLAHMAERRRSPHSHQVAAYAIADIADIAGGDRDRGPGGGPGGSHGGGPVPARGHAPHAPHAPANGHIHGPGPEHDPEHGPGHVAILAPTGTGKTEALLAWASAVTRRLPGQPRVFYVLPYLASINAMAKRLRADLGCDQDGIGLAHSKAAQTLLRWSLEEETSDLVGAARKARSRRDMTRLFRQRLRVGTPYQLMRAVLLGPKHSSLLLDSANSVFLLDEVHAYDPTRLGWLLAMLTQWERLGGRIGIASATLPARVLALIRERLRAPLEVVRADRQLTDRLVRHRLRLAGEELTAPASAGRIAAAIERGDAVLVVANTVARAQALFTQLTPVARRRWPDDPDAAVLLHARFRHRDRHRIEDRLAARYATTARPRRGGLLVTTQVAEVSLDVDLDSGFFDAAPLEALLQRMGRVNRVADRPPADIWVHPPPPTRGGAGGGPRPDQVSPYVGPYPAASVHDAWELLGTLDGTLVTEAAAGVWLDRLYDTDWAARLLAETRMHCQEFTEAFLRFDAPFEDRDDLTEQFDRLFDGNEALLATDLTEYRELAAKDPLLASDLLIPIPQRTIGQLARAGRCTVEQRPTGLVVLDLPYDEQRGLDLGGLRAPDAGPIGETIL